MGLWQRFFGSRGRQLVEAPTLDHPSLGVIRWQREGWWTGERALDGGAALEFCIAGNTNGPEEHLLSALLTTLDRWDETWGKLTAFLKSETQGLPEVPLGDFCPTSVLYLWEEKPGYFMVDLKLSGDEYGIWKVEFIDGQPKYLSRDD